MSTTTMTSAPAPARSPHSVQVWVDAKPQASRWPLLGRRRVLATEPCHSPLIDVASELVPLGEGAVERHQRRDEPFP
jgi:hypothetical protein